MDSRHGNRVASAGSNGHDPTILQAARQLNEWNLELLVYEPRSKNPNTLGTGWDRLPSPPPDALARALGAGEHTLGVHLRRGPAGRTADLDLDWPEAAAAAALAPPAWRLPPTTAWGRASKPRSHFIVCLLNPPSKGMVWRDPDARGAGAKIIEFRVKGQTVAPGSHHEVTGEEVTWADDGRVPPVELLTERVAACGERWSAVALVARILAAHAGEHHDLALPLAGMLFYGAMPEAEAEEFLGWACRVAGDVDELDNRLGAVKDTYRNGGAGHGVTGGRTLVLEDFLTDAQLRKLREWLHLGKKALSGDLVGPDELPLTGNGDGDRFARLYAGQARYRKVDDAWFLWDGTRYKRDQVEQVRELAKQTVREFRRVLGEQQDRCGRNGVAAYRDCSLHAAAMDTPYAITSMLASARSRDDLAAGPDALDADPLLLNTAGGTLAFDLAAGHVASHEHNPEDALTWLAPVTWNPAATHPLFDQFLDRFVPEPETRAYLQELFGACLVGLPKRHAVQLIGPHDAGKSTTLKLLKAMLGDYAASLTSENLTKNPHRGGDAPRSDLWRVREQRVVVVPEVEEHVRLDVALFKSITSGGDPYQLRTLYDASGGRDVVFQCMLWMSGNKPYGPPPDEQAAFDRLEVLQFAHVVAEADRDTAEELALTTDLGVLNAAFAWSVDGFIRLYRDHGGVLRGPEASRRAKVQLQRDLDPLEQLVDDVVDVTGLATDRVLKAVLDYTVKDEALARRGSAGWKKWGHTEQRDLDERLERRGARRKRDTHPGAQSEFGNKPYWEGVRLRGDD